jgi:histidinol-phosphate aminotransferase
MSECSHWPVHGGPDALGVPRYDFSTNSNAVGPGPEALAAVQAADATRYPDPAYAALRKALAAWHDVAPARIVLAGSASEFIFRISAWVARRHAGGGRVWLPAHGYGDYARAAQAWGLALEAQPQSASLLWACDPASPLGMPHPGLAALVEGLTEGQMCVLDSAYEPLRLQGALSLSDAQRDRVWQLWTPNKALGLTGVRAAYAIAPHGAQTLVTQLAAVAPSWPVGAHGVALLHAWTLPTVQAWLAYSLATLREWKQRQIRCCEALGWQVTPSVANFFCARPASDDLAADLQRLRAHGIKLRDTTSFGLPGQVRLGVLAPPAQDALMAAWTSIKEKQG